MLEAADDASALCDALLGPDGDLWGPLPASPASKDGREAPPPKSPPSEGTLSPSLSAASSPVEDALMDYADAWPDHGGYTQCLGAGAESAEAADGALGRPAQSVGAGAPSRLSSLWTREAVGASGTLPSAPDAQPSALLWASPTPALMRVDAKQLPNASTMEIRRRKNRECMRRARQRQREDYARMKAAVAQLEKQYAELCLRARPALDDAAPRSPLAVKAEAGEARRASKSTGERRLAAAVALSRRLGAENLHLKSSLQRHAAWKQSLHRVLDSTADTFADVSDLVGLPPLASLPRTTPAAAAAAAATTAAPSSAHGSPRPMSETADEVDAEELAARFSFTPLDESAVGRAIIDNAHVTQEVGAALLAAAQAKDPRVKRHDVLGWDVIQRVRGTAMEYLFTKTYTDLDIHAAGDRMWLNDMRMDTFRVILYSLRRLDVLQQVSPNAFVLGRDIMSPDCSTVYRSLFMRFRTQVTREIPNGSQPPLQATGFVIGTHSLNRSWLSSSLSPRHAPYRPGAGGPRPSGVNEGEELEWLDMALVTEFLTIEDPATGDKYHQIRWMGRSDPKSFAEAQRNAPDTLTVCLRTELLTLGSAIRLLRRDPGAT